MSLPDGVAVRLFPGEGLTVALLPKAAVSDSVMRSVREVMRRQNLPPEEKATQIERLLRRS